MLIVMEKDAIQEQTDNVINEIKSCGLTPVPIPGTQRTAIGIIGNTQGVSDSKRPKPKKVSNIIVMLPDLIVSAIASVSESSVFGSSFLALVSVSTPKDFSSPVVEDLEESRDVSTLKVKVLSNGS